ncbi:hypothetical protein NPIL_681851 [Nephila pilipes]|uniref:Uncharacterized protein n=1 Tax=Nephila pilipes TaxID=299642 RepID=A0A8X6PUH3_NEPPI|nr:hypothetical protein NPIL_681851 [Nephila pilipes]
MDSDLVSSNSSQDEMEQQPKDESIDMQTSPQNVSDNNCSSNPNSQKNRLPTPLPTTSNIIKKIKVPPITIDNLINTAAFIKELQQVTTIKQSARSAGNSLKLFLPTPGTYNQINSFIKQKKLSRFHISATRRKNAACRNQRHASRYSDNRNNQRAPKF